MYVVDDAASNNMWVVVRVLGFAMPRKPESRTRVRAETTKVSRWPGPARRSSAGQLPVNLGASNSGTDPSHLHPVASALT